MATGVDTCQTWPAHLGEHDDLWSMAGHVHTGSEQQGLPQANSTCGFGAPVHAGLAVMEQLMAVPRFCGGAGPLDDTMEPAQEDEDLQPVVTPTMAVKTPLDYVIQNLQCRTGNYRNRCFANAPFRLWSWAGSFMGGPQLWNKTGAAVHAALQDDGVVNITSLPTLRPLWQQFDDQIQDDASHFLMALADLAESTRIIPGYFHVATTM